MNILGDIALQIVWYVKVLEASNAVEKGQLGMTM